MRRKDEKPPEDHWKHRFPEIEANLLDEYYKFKGWNNEVIPTKETLHELGLDYVGEDLEQRGIYKKEEKKKTGAKQASKKAEKQGPETKRASQKSKKAKA
jgi:aldehyde:ferredoxin oxidoreductase